MYVSPVFHSLLPILPYSILCFRFSRTPFSASDSPILHSLFPILPYSILCFQFFQHLKPKLHPEAIHKIVQCLMVLLRRSRVLHDMSERQGWREARFLFKEWVVSSLQQDTYLLLFEAKVLEQGYLQFIRTFVHASV